MKRYDLLTKEEFVPSRITQKFAKAENRIRYYNLKATEFRHSIDYINKPLLKNIKILNELMMRKNEATFHLQYLKGKGFSTTIHSHIEQINGKNHFAIHRYILILLENEQIKIVKKEL